MLEITAYGAWNGGTLIDNSIYENQGMFFKGAIPVNHRTIEERIGVRTRRAAPPDERIGVIALQNLLDTSGLDPARVKLIIGATNVGEDKYDPGPLIRHPFELIRGQSSQTTVLDLYAGCPGFNVATEFAFMLSLSGMLKAGDISIIVGAENIHRAKTFRPLDTSNLLFGDDALATALETRTSASPKGHYTSTKRAEIRLGKDFPADIAEKIFELNGPARLDGIIVDNQLGRFLNRVPATAARVQRRLVERMHPGEVAGGTFQRFRDALAFYDRRVKSFGFDIMTGDRDPRQVERFAEAYVRSGRYAALASVYLESDSRALVRLHRGEGFTFARPSYGILDTLTRTHGCFAQYIEVVPAGDEVFAEIDGKGVFLHATRGAGAHLSELLSRNGTAMEKIDLVIEHQANFAMIPLTLERVLDNGRSDVKEAVADYIADRMVTNIHERGNCSVVCMQRLPYDLERGALKEDRVQGFVVNRNLARLRGAKTILNDSVGTGMTRSSVLQRKR